jgi:hypothetical protein
MSSRQIARFLLWTAVLTIFSLIALIFETII